MPSSRPSGPSVRGATDTRPSFPNPSIEMAFTTKEQDRAQDRDESQEKKRLLVQRLLNRRARPVPVESPLPATQGPVASDAPESEPASPVRQSCLKTRVPVYSEDETVPSAWSHALRELVSLYLDAAQNRTRHIALVWPTPPRALPIVHALSTVERWATGDKVGVRGLLVPAKTNAFNHLNHLHFDRQSILDLAGELYEKPGRSNPRVTRSLIEKDSFMFSMGSMKPETSEAFHPTMSELIPHFFAGPGSKPWASCAKHLLEHIRAKVSRRTHKKSLVSQCEFIGAPGTAPDAMFALDMRMSKDEIRNALAALKKAGPPEVVLVNATRQVRFATRGWANAIPRICSQIEDVFGSQRPGIVVVTDDPPAAFALRQALLDQDKQRATGARLHPARDYRIVGVCGGSRDDGLLPAGVSDAEVPDPKEFNVEVVDTEAARVIDWLYRIAARLPGGRDSARPILDAAAYLARLAALPCGVNTLVEWLAETTTSEGARRVYSWSTFHAGLAEFQRSEEGSGERGQIQKCMDRGTRLYEDYTAATPFALRLATLVERVAQSPRQRVVVAFTNATNRRLAERFLDKHHFGNGATFEQFAERVEMITSSQLDDRLSKIDGAYLVLAGLDDETLRLVMLDNRVPKHTAVLLTQRNAQRLRAVLKPLDEKFPEFRTLKPRMESFLRQLSKLPEEQTMFVDDFVLPAFRTELATETTESTEAADPEAYRISLQDGAPLFRRPTHTVYVYDPASSESTDCGFRPCEVKSLEPGDRLFVMSHDLRELVESVLKEAGVPIEHDRSFEGALRDYHQEVINNLNNRYPGKSEADQVRKLRAAIFAIHPEIEADFPGEQAVRYWINLGDSPDTPFEQLKPQAPMKEAHFCIFAGALGFTQLQAAYYWQRVIMAIRNARRLDGRHVSDLYAYMLLQPESAMVHGKVPQQTLKVLFQKARENILVVEDVTKPERSDHHD